MNQKLDALIRRSPMFERYTEKARRVIFFARQEASELGGPAIEPHHILLGLIREDPPLITRFCKLTLPLLDLRDRIRASTGPVKRLPASVDMPLSSQTKHVLSYAADESQQLNHRYLSTEHLLLGLLREEQTTAAEILIEHGVYLNIVRDELRGGTIGSADMGKTGCVEEMRRLAAEARYLATAILAKAERMEAICNELTESSPDQKGDG
jgi:ATP-dependent Clp protease ATP-binding subunit ClpC